MFSAILLTSLAMFAPAHATPKALTFASMLSGRFSDIDLSPLENYEVEQYQQGFMIMLQPVLVPNLQPLMTFYGREWVNGSLMRHYLTTVKEGGDGLIHMDVYDFPGRHTIRNFTEDLVQNLTAPRQCHTIFQQVEETVFVGIWPFCTGVSGEVPEQFIIILTCNSFIACPPNSGMLHVNKLIERINLLPYMTSGVDGNSTQPCRA
ncbi:uncharacterized protein LOC131936314 [Physella acuta]|uniref:uncharacterized protein LOC131936314 n=1 Tax=Physella acuta TaxID=109671 RepID=UPI0027DBCB8C|nr:uncharacterized protein LOC131936314 [Physella acuta]